MCDPARAMRAKTKDHLEETAFLSAIAAERRAQIGVSENIQHYMWEKFADDWHHRTMETASSFSGEAPVAKRTAQTPLSFSGEVIMTRKEVQAFFRRGHTFVDAIIASGELDSFLDGRSRWILLSSCEARLERLKGK
jgi:hypothetical protein